MKRPLLLLSAMMFAGLASAQSSVTLFGLLDMTLARSTGSIADKSQLTQGAWGASRLGFKGVEDLGGGLSAGFWLESAVFPDNGTGGATNINNQSSGTSVAPNGTQGLTFNRRSTVSLVGGLGEVRIGRDFVPTFWNLNRGDVFGSSGAGQAVNFSNQIAGTGNASVRASNMITYWVPQNSTGFGGSIAHYFGENASNTANSNDGTGSGAQLFYNAGGAFTAGVAYGRTKYLTGDAVARNISATYDFKVAKLVGEYSKDSLGAANATGGAIGLTVPVGANVPRVAYSWVGNDAAGNPKIKRFAIGDTYYLSKRTWMYVTYSHQSNSGGSSAALDGAITGPNASSNALELGYVHSF
ncbi:porin [Rhodoferax sediminis]|nr:porin [Rhodoferax sediminis]